MTSKDKQHALLGLAFILFCILVIIFAPLGTIWVLNTLFNLGIVYTFKTWLASFLFTAIFGRSNIRVKS